MAAGGFFTPVFIFNEIIIDLQGQACLPLLIDGIRVKNSGPLSIRWTRLIFYYSYASSTG